MTFARDMRERQIAAQPAERSGIVGTIAIAVAAFVIGGGAIAAWRWYPKSSPPAAARAALPAVASDAPAPKFADNRLGRAATAPLLTTCIKSEVFAGFNGGNAQAIYTVMTTAGTMHRLAPLVGADMSDGVPQLAEYWREIADCVYQQNSWHLCDADNRALAVESVAGFIRGAAQVAAQPLKTRDAQMILADNARARQRVLEALRARLRNGQLIAADFSALQPPEVKSLLNEIKPAANGCVRS